VAAPGAESAVDDWLVVCCCGSPLHYNRLVTHRRVLAAIALVWVMSALISFLPIQLGWHRGDPVPGGGGGGGGHLPRPNVTGAGIAAPGNRSSDAEDSSSSSASQSQSQCVLDLSPVYAVVSSMISFYLPCVAMTFFYYRLHRYARRHAANINRYHHAKQPTLVVVDDGGGLTPRRAAAARGGGGGGGGVSEHKAAITLGVIMGVFLLCWVCKSFAYNST